VRGWVHLVCRPLIGLLNQPWTIDLWSSGWSDNWQENRTTRRKPATSSITNPTWLDLRSNVGRHGWKPAASGLSCGTELISQLFELFPAFCVATSSVGIATGCRLFGPGGKNSTPGRCHIFFSPRHPVRFCGPPSHMSYGYLGAICPELKRQECEADSELQLLPRSRRHGYIHPIPRTSHSCRISIRLHSTKLH
jgi:hypothetical protein